MRHATDRIDIPNKQPLWHQEGVGVVKKHRELWFEGQGEIAGLDNDSCRNMEMSKQLSKITNRLLHMDERANADRLPSLPGGVQNYLLDIAVWLADLLDLAAAGLNFLSQHKVPTPRTGIFGPPPSREGALCLELLHDDYASLQARPRT